MLFTLLKLTCLLACVFFAHKFEHVKHVMSGRIPAEFGQLSRLTHLNLSNCRLIGKPLSLFFLSFLRRCGSYRGTNHSSYKYYSFLCANAALKAVSAFSVLDALISSLGDVDVAQLSCCFSRAKQHATSLMTSHSNASACYPSSHDRFDRMIHMYVQGWKRLSH